MITVTIGKDRIVESNFKIHEYFFDSYSKRRWNLFKVFKHSYGIPS